jgi:hypothetical protein
MHSVINVCCSSTNLVLQVSHTQATELQSTVAGNGICTHVCKNVSRSESKVSIKVKKYK